MSPGKAAGEKRSARREKMGKNTLQSSIIEILENK